MTYKTTVQRLATISTVTSAGLLVLMFIVGRSASLTLLPLFFYSLPVTLVLRLLARASRNGVQRTATEIATTAGRVAGAVGVVAVAVLENLPDDDDSSENNHAPGGVAFNWDSGEYELVGPHGMYDHEVK